MKKIMALLLIFAITNIKLNINADSAVIYGPTVIHKQVNSILTMSDILALYQSDLGPVTVSIDEYTGNGNIVSIYALQLYASDGTSIGTKNIEVHVINNLGNVKAVSDYKNVHLTLSQAKEMTLAEIPKVIARTGYFTLMPGAQMAIISDTFTASKQTPGIYNFEYRIVDSTGYDETFLSNIYVYDSNNMIEPDFVYGNKPNTMDSVTGFIKTAFFMLAVGVGVAFIYRISKSKKVI